MGSVDRPESWRDAFEESVRRWASKEGPRLLLQESVDAYLSEFPLEPEDDEQLNDLHRAALRTIVMRHVAFISNDFERAAAQCESPIERAMLYAVALVAWDWTDSVLLRVDGHASGLFASRSIALEIEPQADVGKYRVDFLLTLSAPLRADPTTRPSVRMVLECDGHDWHEKTREQAARDRERDRALQQLDLAVFRYTGSDIWRDVFQHAYEAVGELARRLDAFLD
jgi:very-short-patch-repair endonuclease